MYDRLDWADLDRFQQTATATEVGDLVQLQIGDEEYEEFFQARSPLDPQRLTELVARVCALSPEMVAVDILTGDWPVDFYGSQVSPRLQGCPVVWIREALDATTVPRRGGFVVTPGPVLGRAEVPPGACSALPLFTQERDGVERYYQDWFSAGMETGSSGVSRVPHLAATLAAGIPGGCTAPGPDGASEPERHRIRFTAHERFTRVPAGFLLRADSAAVAELATIFRGKVVLLGGTYRYARDQHRTPLGTIHGLELIANAIHTARAAPIRELSGAGSFTLSLVVSALLFGLLLWLDLRWLWGLLASLALSLGTALILCWFLFNYLGYFLGVLAGLAGVVLAELITLLWPTVQRMSGEWWAQRPTPPPSLPDMVEPLIPTSIPVDEGMET